MCGTRASGRLHIKKHNQGWMDGVNNESLFPSPTVENLGSRLVVESGVSVCLTSELFAQLGTRCLFWISLCFVVSLSRCVFFLFLFETTSEPAPVHHWTESEAEGGKRGVMY